MEGNEPVEPGSCLGFDNVLPALPSGSVDDPVLAAFIHAGSGSGQVLKLKGWVTGLE
jgi:hypothetical protein